MSEHRLFWKLAKPDGWDFYTGKTINYRENVGKEVVCPKFDKQGKLCSEAFIHASPTPDRCFIGARIPCSVYRVKGGPIMQDKDKAGFEKLYIIRELQPERVFTWNYLEAVNPVNPLAIQPPKITSEHIALVNLWASVGASVVDSVWDSVRASVVASIWAYVGYLFPLPRKAWKYTEKIKCNGYPFQPAVDLWTQGLVPSFDGKTGRLHGGAKAEILWEGGRR